MRHTETFTGRIGQVRDIIELNNGNCVVNFSVAETPRYKDNQTNEWKDGTTIWTNCSIFGDEARNLHRSVKPGTFVTITGTRQAREYTPKDSTETRVVQQVVVDQAAVAITKFDYIESLGNVNYAQEGRGGGSAPTQSSNQQSQGQSSQPAQPAKEANKDPFDDDPFSDDAFGGDDSDPFGLGT